MTKEYQDYPTYQKAHRLTVDSYGVQHPGNPQERNAVQSVNIHLIALHLSLAENKPAQYIVHCMDEILRKKRDFIWLTPPDNPRWMTVLDVIKAETAVEHEYLVKAWARSVYEAWSGHHATIENIIQSTLYP